MTFLALIVSLGLLQYWGSGGPVQTDVWFRKVVGTVAGWGLMAELRLGLAVLGPALLLFWLQVLVSDWLFGAVMLAIMVLVLLYSFGRDDFESLVDRYREYCRRGDFQGASLFARERMDQTAGEECPDGPEELHRWVKEHIGYRGFERWFGVIFWFALLSAPGALAYRLLHLYGEMTEDAEQRRMVCRVLFWVDWVPVRLLMLAYALTGDWVGSRDQVMRSMQDTQTPNAGQLSDVAHAALGLKTTVSSSDDGDTRAFAEICDWEIGELRSLLSRSAVAWVVVLSVLVLMS